MLCALRCGQLSRRVSNCACRDSVSFCVSLPNRPQITQICADESKTEPAIAHISLKFAGSVRLPTWQPERLLYQHGILRASHVGAGASIDLDQFAFLDEKRHVNSLAGFELCRLGDVTGRIAAKSFR